MAGCSADVAPLEPVLPNDYQGPELYSDIPVEFGYEGMTKAPMTNDVLSEGHDFRLFSVEEGTQDLTQSSELYIYDEKINYHSGYGFRFKNDSYYYPGKSDKKYNFYSYYSFYSEVLKGQRETKVRFYSYQHRTQNQVTQPGTLGSYDGDVLFSKATMDITDETGTSTIDAFNAQIVRDNNKKPVFNFKHVTAALHFKTTLKLTRDMGPYIIRIAGLRLKNSPAQADMWLVNLDDPSKDGTFDPASLRMAENVSQRPFLKNDRGDSGSLNFDMGPDFKSGTLASGYMFIVPQKEPLRCIMHVMRINPADSRANASYYYEFDLDPKDYNPELTEGHEAGMLYNYNIVLDWGSTFIDPKSVGPIVKNATQVPKENWNSL